MPEKLQGAPQQAKPAEPDKKVEELLAAKDTKKTETPEIAAPSMKDRVNQGLKSMNLDPTNEFHRMLLFGSLGMPLGALPSAFTGKNLLRNMAMAGLGSGMIGYFLPQIREAADYVLSKKQ